MQKTPEISTILSSSAGLVVADIHGSVYLLTRDFEIAKSWIAHTGGRVTHMAERRGMLITLGVRRTVFGGVLFSTRAVPGRGCSATSVLEGMGPSNLRQEDRHAPSPALREGTER